jgi:hypothetical protein
MKTHKDSGCRCLVAHYDDEGELLPACIKCEVCHEYIRPEDMNLPCSEVPVKKEYTFI